VAIEGVESLNRLELLEPLVNDPNPEVSKQVKELVEALKSADK
jgi:hypothetical protein